MTEELKTTKYTDGTPVHFLTDSEYHCMFFEFNCHLYSGPYYMNSLSSVPGRIYDFGAVYSGKLAPEGWHVPGNEDMAASVEYLGGSDIAGGKLKESGTSHWQAPNIGATN